MINIIGIGKFTPPSINCNEVSFYFKIPGMTIISFPRNFFAYLLFFFAERIRGSLT